MNHDHVLELPACGEIAAPIVFTAPVQLLAYHVAVLRGTDADQPKNLAKSVTVEWWLKQSPITRWSPAQNRPDSLLRHARHHLPHPWCEHSHRDKGNRPGSDAAVQPFRRESGFDTLTLRQDEGRDDGDHDGRQQGAKQDGSKASGNAHGNLLFELNPGKQSGK